MSVRQRLMGAKAAVTHFSEEAADPAAFFCVSAMSFYTGDPGKLSKSSKPRHFEKMPITGLAGRSVG